MADGRDDLADLPAAGVPLFEAADGGRGGLRERVSVRLLGETESAQSIARSPALPVSVMRRMVRLIGVENSAPHQARSAAGQ